jgi:hypothetical protein
MKEQRLSKAETRILEQLSFAKTLYVYLRKAGRTSNSSVDSATAVTQIAASFVLLAGFAARNSQSNPQLGLSEGQRVISRRR